MIIVDKFIDYCLYKSYSILIRKMFYPIYSRIKHRKEGVYLIYGRTELSEPLLEAIQRMQYCPDETHLPLANSPHRFLAILMKLSQLENGRASVIDLSEHFKITPRQIFFYSETGDRTFGLFDRSEKSYVKLTEIGHSVALLPLNKQIAYLQSKLLRSPSFREIQKNINRFKTTDMVEVLKKNEEFRSRFSDSSLTRRAGTLLSWAKWFQENNLQADDNEISDYIRENKELIYSLVHRLKKRPDQLQEYYSVAVLGLQKALLKYDKTRENRFSTFAYTCMENEIFFYMRSEKKWAKSIPIDMGQRDSYGEVDTGYRASSVFSVEEKLADNTLTTEEQYIKKETLDRMNVLIKELSLKEQKIIQSFYFNYKSQAQIGIEEKMSQANVSKILKTVLLKLKAKFILEEQEVA